MGASSNNSINNSFPDHRVRSIFPEESLRTMNCCLVGKIAFFKVERNDKSALIKTVDECLSVEVSGCNTIVVACLILKI